MTRSSLFTRAYTARKSVNTPLFTLYVLPKNNRPGSKSAVGVSIPKESTRNGSGSQAVDKMPLVRMPLVGFVISKKVCKSACQRNRAKRRVREAYRTMRKEMVESVQRLEQWYALVFVLNNKALEANWEEIRGTVAGCLTKADSKFGMGTRERKPS
ncbi:MAG: ribonuclease P protein component [Cyanobacteria bacterium SZAS LIN-5]|nr:ribonuclease P protein component [Cyanobacteria bacterium SZAS LIN-5]